MATISSWGTANATLLEPLSYIDSNWGTVSTTLDAAFSSGAVPSVYNQNTQTWVTAQPMLWNHEIQEWEDGS